ncbi:MAG: right-handed parallel beta-helix repeat-containing protein [Armatimonadota bacterium]
MKRLPVIVILIALFFAVSPAWAKVVYVKSDSPGPLFDGTSWNTAFHSVQRGINAAVSGDEVWVAAGTYLERITLMNGVELYGGFSGSETERGQRDSQTNVTVLNGQKGGSVVSARNLSAGLIDGFTIRDGSASGVYCSFSSIAITNNTIINNSTSSQGGGGIYCSGGYTTSPTITNNIISDNIVGGIMCAGCSPVIVSNFITRNTNVWNYDAGLSCDNVTVATIINNTIVGNSAQGIYCDRSTPTVVNNIVAYNRVGIYASSSTLTLRNNCVYGNTNSNYSGTSAGADDISEDPKLANGTYDVHIYPSSSCKDKGDNSVVQTGWADIDGDSRILPLPDGIVDIGADESDGRTYNYTGLVSFSPSAGVYTTGLTH